MKPMKPSSDNEQGLFIEERTSQDWEDQDTSEILEKGESEKLEIAKPEYQCPKCGSSRIRKRTIDLPVLDNRLIFKAVKTLHCPECGASVIEQKSLERTQNMLRELASNLTKNQVSDILSDALSSYEGRWREMARERKTIVFYFPTRSGSPAKAQIAIQISDPLFPKLRALSSEEIRDILGMKHLEDLEEEANKQHRTISQFLKLELNKRLFPGETRDLDRIGIKTAFKLVPRTVSSDYLTHFNLQGLRLAADTEKQSEIVVLESPSKELIASLAFDYMDATLTLQIHKSEIDLEKYIAEIRMHDEKCFTVTDLRVKDNKVLLLSDTEYTADKVSEIDLIQKD